MVFPPLGGKPFGNLTESQSFNIKTMKQFTLKLALALMVFNVQCFMFNNAYAQRDIVKSLQTDAAGQGKVTIHQDAQITALVAGAAITNPAKAGEKKELKRQGYRVQVYAGNNTSRSRNEAQEVANKVKQHFQDAQVYAYFISPRWLCRVGNFPSIEEADAMMRQLKATGVFKEVSIVRDQITIEIN